MQDRAGAAAAAGAMAAVPKTNVIKDGSDQAGSAILNFQYKNSGRMKQSFDCFCIFIHILFGDKNVSKIIIKTIDEAGNCRYN